jgi:hypothetical protein
MLGAAFENPSVGESDPMKNGRAAAGPDDSAIAPRRQHPVANADVFDRPLAVDGGDGCPRRNAPRSMMLRAAEPVGLIAGEELHPRPVAEDQLAERAVPDLDLLMGQAGEDARLALDAGVAGVSVGRGDHRKPGAGVGDRVVGHVLGG